MKETKRVMMEGVPCTSSKLVASNTVEYHRENGDRVIRLHHTDILTFKPDGTCVFNSGGWKTVTTKERMNSFGPHDVHIWTEQRVWYVSKGRGPWLDPDVPQYVYADGMSYHPERGFRGVGQKPDKALVKRIKAYAKAFAAKLPVDLPSLEDCWYCSLRHADTSKPIGDSMDTLHPDGTVDHRPNHDHLLSHIEEKCYVPSLLWNVLLEHGCDPQDGGAAWFWGAFKNPNREQPYFVGGADYSRKQYAKWIYDYLYVRLIDGRNTA